MLTFFRRIRKGLLSQKASSNYLIYAIGEIALVVIGILIALQINNWNEWRKERILEIVTLNEIMEALETEATYINSVSAELKMDALKMRSLLIHLQEGKTYSDSLSELFFYPYRGIFFTQNQSAYSQLTNRGIDIISNSELKKKIVDHYEFEVPRFVKFNESEARLRDDFRIYYQTKVTQKLNDSFIGHTGRIYAKTYPLDYESLKSDTYFHNQLIWRIAKKEKLASRLNKNLSQHKEKLRKEIEVELQGIR